MRGDVARLQVVAVYQEFAEAVRDGANEKAVQIARANPDLFDITAEDARVLIDVDAFGFVLAIARS